MGVQQLVAAVGIFGVVACVLTGLISVASRVARAASGERSRVLVAWGTPLLASALLGYASGGRDGGLLFLCWVGLVGLVSAAGVVLSLPATTRLVQGKFCLELAGVLAVGGAIGGLAGGMWRH